MPRTGKADFVGGFSGVGDSTANGCAEPDNTLQPTVAWYLESIRMSKNKCMGTIYPAIFPLYEADLSCREDGKCSPSTCGPFDSSEG